MLASDFFKDRVASKTVIPTKILCSESENPLPSSFSTLADLILEHEPIPFVTYPYEWCFNEWHAAALLTLDLLEKANAAGYTLKDGSAFNVMLSACKPIFIDVLSLALPEASGGWIGYRQFCREFLFPLLLTALKGLDSRFLMIGRMTGITSHETWRLLGRSSLVRRGIARHVYLQSHFEARFTNHDLQQTLSDSIGFSPDQTLSITRTQARSLRRTLDVLKSPEHTSHWLGYDKQDQRISRDPTFDHEAKNAFLADRLAQARWKKVIDFGCNTGRYSLLATEHAQHVLAIDADPACIATLRERCFQLKIDSITTVVTDLLAPSPALGWREGERPSLMSRLHRYNADGGLMLALIHHLCLSGHRSIHDVVSWVTSLAREVILEWVDKKDPMVQLLLRSRQDIFPDYRKEIFESVLSKHASILAHIELGSRSLYHVQSRDNNDEH